MHSNMDPVSFIIKGEHSMLFYFLKYMFNNVLLFGDSNNMYIVLELCLAGASLAEQSSLSLSLIQDSVYNLSRQYEEKVRPCIDLIDSLRALGVEQDLALPAIAVIGDQSSGKSSVLEALSGVALPRGSGERSVLLALPGHGPGTSEIATDIL